MTAAFSQTKRVVAQGEQVPGPRQVGVLVKRGNKFWRIPRGAPDHRLNLSPISTNVRRGCIDRRGFRAARGGLPDRSLEPPMR
jgi:hypothetical protein